MDVPRMGGYKIIDPLVKVLMGLMYVLTRVARQVFPLLLKG